MNLNTAITKLKKLPSPLQAQVLDYIEFIIQKYDQSKTQPKNFTFSWEGELSGLNKKSVDLQHEANKLR